MLGLDYAGSSPGAAAVKAAGYGFVARYLSRYTAKTIKKPEYDDMTSNGVAVVLVFEDYANQALSGYNQGVADAQVALAQANALGWPQDRPIHFAVDFDISDAQKPVAGEYMKGVISVIGLARTGAYGGYWWVKYCYDNNLCTFGWQAVAWSGGNIDARATLFQQLGGTTVNGTSCDINRSLKDDFGQNIGVNMPSTTGLDEARIISYGVGGRNGIHVDGDNVTVVDTDNALGGSTDGDLEAHHVGQILDDEVRGWYNSDEGQSWRNVRLNQLVGLAQQVAPLKKQLGDTQALVTKDGKIISDLTTQVTVLKKQLAGVNDPNHIVITKNGWAALWTAIQSFFKKNN